MKIAFIDNNPKMSKGSYRIHINDLSYYFNQLGYESKINPSNLNHYDIFIHGKTKQPKFIKNKINGIITPNKDDIKILKIVNFIIVGSVEEKESLIEHNKNCFLFPQIEKMYSNVKPKIHSKKDKIIIGYHGNQNHLNHMSCGLKNALEKLNKKYNIELVFICSNKDEWIQGRPKIPTVFKKWNIKTIINDIKNFDIGIIPNISEFVMHNKLNNNNTLGKYNTDYMIRFKNKSNIGRALVLFQLGIPVVADITPSNMHILANPDNGYAVLSEYGWYTAIQDLMDEDKRNFISNNACEEYKRLYDPLKWAKSLLKNIEITSKIK